MRHLPNLFYRALLLSFILGIVFSVATFASEHPVNPAFRDFSDLFYWCISSMTTVGAGGMHPITPEGKFFGALSLIFCTVMYFGLFSELIIWVKNRSDRHHTGRNPYRGRNHILIVGYNAVTISLLHLLAQIVREEVDIVLLTSALEHNPMPQRIVFVRASANTYDSLEKVNAGNAAMAFSLADDNNADSILDVNAMLVAGIIEDMNHEVYTMVEITHPHKATLDRSTLGIDRVINYSELIGYVRDPKGSHSLAKKIPPHLREQLLRDEYHL